MSLLGSYLTNQELHYFMEKKLLNVKNATCELFFLHFLLYSQYSNRKLDHFCPFASHVCELSDSDAIRQPMEWITKQGFIYRGTQLLNTALRVVRAPLGNTNIS